MSIRDEIQETIAADMLQMLSRYGEYTIDMFQRTILMADTLRRRGNNYFTHLWAGQPPVLVFDYEMILDGRTFERPVNYSLVRILDRRQSETDSSSQTVERRQPAAGAAATATPKRPIIIIDPRAGHGPGIGGFKKDSEIGIALDEGHPVYFVIFYQQPEPGQTIAAVQQAEIRFIETVARRHRNAPKPAVIGNCQAGWAAALIAADRPDVVGPLVFNGSPLSYWAGVDGKNPMRYKGGLLGGVWTASLVSDLGGGLFDGAHLVAGFEDLNPANTYWGKLRHLYTHIDTEPKRFLEFERWWNGFYLMTGEEIHFIVENLFVGNKLARGQVELDPGRALSLRNIREPVIVFASSGDNITPPQQALNWILQVWRSADDIRSCGQTIVYILHETIGHLGIFVSGSVARREHRGIIGILGLVDLLGPGLYEMVISDGVEQQVEFVPRSFEDIRKLDDGQEDEDDFPLVAKVSEANDRLYRLLWRPWVRALTTPLAAQLSRDLHPSRVATGAWSDLNPGMWPVAAAAPAVRRQRQPAGEQNPFNIIENCWSESIRIWLDWYRDSRDQQQEFWFKWIYGNSWLKTLIPTSSEAQPAIPAEPDVIEPDAYLTGGVAAATIRIMLALSAADAVIDKRELRALQDLMKTHPSLSNISRETLKRLVGRQKRLLDADPQYALETLPQLIPTPEARDTALEIAKCMAIADEKLTGAESQMLLDIFERLHGGV